MKILLKEICKEMHVSTRQLEDMSKLSKSTISRIQNETLSPTMDQMEALAAALKTRISNLYESKYK